MISNQLLDALLSPLGGNPSPRAQAETFLHELSSDDRARGFMAALLQQQQQIDPNTEARIQLIAVLLRRDIASLAGDVLRKQLASETSVALLKELLEPLVVFFQAESQTANCRRLVGHCLAELCASLSLLSPDDGRATFMVIFEKIEPMCAQASLVGLRLMTALLDRAPLSFSRSDAMMQRFLIVMQSASSNLHDALALEALTETVCGAAITTEASEQNMGILNTVAPPRSTVDPGSKSARLGVLLLPLLDHMTRSLTDSDSISRCMQHLTYTTGLSPSCLAGDFNVLAAVVRTCLILANSAQLEVDVQLAALQVLASLTSVDDVRRNILPSPRGVSVQSMLLDNRECKGVLQLCAQFCVDGIDDDSAEEWAQEPASLVDEGMVWEGDEVAAHAESLLGTFLRNLGGGQQSLPIILPIIETLLNSPDWKHTRAALAMLEQCLFCVPASFSPHKSVALRAALQLASSSSVRVQFQAVTLLGVLCVGDSDQLLRRQDGSTILNAVTRLVASNVSKVAAAASVTLVSYCRERRDNDSDRSGLVMPYAKQVLSVLVARLSAPTSEGDVGTIAVQIRALGAIACMAEAIQEGFATFCSDLMPCLLRCVQIPSDRYEVVQLRGAAIEAIAIVMQSIGEENASLVAADAEQVLQLLLPILKNAEATTEEVIPMDQMLSACARIATMVGEKYVAMMEVVLPHLLKRLRADADVTFSEGTEQGYEASKRGDIEMDETEDVESMTVVLPGKGLTKVTIDIGNMEEKAQACRAITEHAEALDGSFGPYAAETLAALHPLITFRYYPDVRSAASQASAAVFQTICSQEEQVDTSLAQEYLPLLSALMREQLAAEDVSNTETRFVLADSLSDVLFYAYRSATRIDRTILSKFTQPNAHRLAQVMTQLIRDCLQRRADLIKAIASCGEDERIELEDELKGEEQVLTPMVDSLGYSLKFLKELYTPIFDEMVAPVLGPYLAATGDERARFAAICLFDDVVEHCGSIAAQKYTPWLLEGIVHGLETNKDGGDEDVVRVALYGLAQIARHGPPNALEQHGCNVIKTILAIASAPGSDAENPWIVENAISALGSLVLFGKAPMGQLGAADKQAILSMFLSQLPLREDEDEAQICHDGFCDLVQNGAVPAEDTKSVLRIIGDTLAYIADGENLALPATQIRFAEILVKFQREVPGKQMEEAFQSLSTEAQASIDHIVQDYATHSANLMVSM